jgi:hypothetical protein
LRCTDQSIQLVADDLVALTDNPFQAFPIEDLDMAARVMDQTYVLQVSSSYGYAFSSSTYHIGDILLCHQDLGAVHSIMAQEQPSAEALFQGVQTVADSRL